MSLSPSIKSAVVALLVAMLAASPLSALRAAPSQHVIMLASRRAGKLQLEGYDDEETTATELGVTTRTLKNWRRVRIGPPVTFIGRRPAYNRASKQAWLKSREQPMPRERSRARKGSEGAGSEDDRRRTAPARAYR